MHKALQKILYVEDEPDIQRVVKLALEAMAGIAVQACGSGEEAIASAPDTIVDLILLDVMMPKMDGPSTLQQLRRVPHLAKTPVVFMTAKAQPDEIAQLKALGALDVIAKPFDPITLADRLRAIWQRGIDVPETAPIDSRELSVEERFAARMVALTEQFQQELPARLATVRRLWLALQQQWDADTLNELHRATHNLAGAGATFGYDEMTLRARAVDRHFKQLLHEKRQPDGALLAEIDRLFVELERSLQSVVSQLEQR